MLLYVDKTSKYGLESISYIKYLIKANNSQITRNWYIIKRYKAKENSYYRKRKKIQKESFEKSTRIWKTIKW